MSKTKKTKTKTKKTAPIIPRSIGQKYFEEMKIAFFASQAVTIGTLLHPEFNLDKIPNLTQENKSAIIATSKLLKEHFGDTVPHLLANVIGLYNTLFIGALQTTKEDLEYIIENNKTTSSTTAKLPSKRIN
jgi:hypothetical protein